MEQAARPRARTGAQSGPHWWLTEDLTGFLDRAGVFLHAEPVLHTMMLTVLESLRLRGPHVYGAGTPHFGAWTEADGTVRGAFVRTPPLNVLLSPLPVPAPASAAPAPPPAPGADGLRAVAALADVLAPRVPDRAGVMSDQATAAAFATAWRRGTGAVVGSREHERLYRLGTLTPPRPAPAGRARIAVESDSALLERWYVECAEALGTRGIDPAVWAASRIATGAVTLWETPDGTPAAMAASTPSVAGQVRVAPVYTPAELRGRGYAGAATAELSRRLRETGDEVLLFTDLANPTSNSLYQRIGYRPVRDYDVLLFSGGRAPR